MLPAIKEIDNQGIDDGHIFSFQSHVSLWNDIGRNAHGRDSSSDAAVTAFVDDLSGSAPLNIIACTYREQF